MSQTPQEQAASPMPPPEQTAAPKTEADKFTEFQTQADQIKSEINSLPTEQYLTGTSHWAISERAPPNAQNMARYRMIRTETLVPDYGTRLTADSQVKQKELQSKLDVLTSQANAEAAVSPEFNELLYKYNNPPVTEQDVHDVAMLTWGASIDYSYNGRPSSDA